MKTINLSEHRMHALQNNMTGIKDFQNRIDLAINNLSECFFISPRELYEPIRYVLSLGGKRIRPICVLLANHLFDGKEKDAMSAALAIEIFHNFTLVHDDIMDNAPIRRNQPTIHHKWNSSVAILSGDVMLVKSFQLLSESPCFNQLFPVFCEMAIKVCEGQQLDLNYQHKDKISVSQYFEMIELKTATLIAACMKIGAFTANAKPDDAEKIYEFGKNIGMMFQLQDDLLDVYGEKEKFGKQRGGDIISNKKTFLMVKAIELSESDTRKKAELTWWMKYKPKNEKEKKEKVERVKSVYDFFNVKKMAEDKINSFHRKAISTIKKIPVHDARKEMLLSFIKNLLSREA